MVKRTSSAVSVLPSWKVTPSRRRNSQVVSSTAFQDSASDGRSWSDGSRESSVS
ncbi:hypothetical protein [Teichococcus aestuarii]|uniref:hypothetical protein n=1 Tax=Teichococcus aestuarii TaxID=568898 RepID=UPI003620F04F